MCPRLTLFAIGLAAGCLLGQNNAAQWRPAPPLETGRSNACAVRLADGRVLVTGGSGNEGPISSVEVFRSAPEEAFETVPPMNVPRSGHACVLLADGRVLVAGGEGPDAPVAEFYDPSIQQWTIVNSSLAGNRGAGITATVVPDGRVLLAGGLRPLLEMFDPDTNEMQALGVSLASARQGHTATLLADGRVLIAGGRVEGIVVTSSEVYDSLASTLAVGPSLTTARAAHTATLLFDARVLIAGGTSGTEEVGELEMFTGERNAFEALNIKLATPRQNHFAVLLPANGGVLLAGGSASGEALGSSEIFEPWHDRISTAGSLTAARTSMAAVALEDGNVLAVGGRNAAGASRSCGVLRPTIVFAFSQSRYRPLERATIRGSFNANSTATATVNLQLQRISLASNTTTVVNSRLLTTTLTARADGTIQITPIMNVAREDIGNDFVLTAHLDREAVAQARFTVRLSPVLTLTPVLPAFTGAPVQARLVLTADGSPVDMGGTRTLVVGTRSASTIGLSSVQVSSQNDLSVCCESVAGTLQATGRYSGNVFLDPASASTNIAIGSKTPTVRIGPTALRLLQPGQIIAEVLFDQGSLEAGNPPRGNVVLRNSGVTVATLPLANNLALDSGVPRGAIFSFTPTLIDRRKPPCFTAHYEGDTRYNPAQSPSTCIAVGPAPTGLQISMGASTTYTLGDLATLSATLTWPDSVGIVGRTLNVTAGTTPVGSITLTPDPTGKGIATGTASVTLPFQTTSLTFTYPASGDLSLASNALRTTMGPIRTTMTATIPSPTTNPFSITYRLRLITGGAAIPGTVSLGAAVQFFDGTELLGSQTPQMSPAGVTDGTSNTITFAEPPSFNGIFTNVIRPLGQRSIRVRFPGSTLFQAAEVTVPVVVQ
jgi:hypothetical protein